MNNNNNNNNNNNVTQRGMPRGRGANKGQGIHRGGSGQQNNRFLNNNENNNNAHNVHRNQGEYITTLYFSGDELKPFIKGSENTLEHRDNKIYVKPMNNDMDELEALSLELERGNKKETAWYINGEMQTEKEKPALINALRLNDQDTLVQDRNLIKIAKYCQQRLAFIPGAYVVDLFNEKIGSNQLLASIGSGGDHGFFFTIEKISNQVFSFTISTSAMQLTPLPSFSPLPSPSSLPVVGWKTASLPVHFLMKYTLNLSAPEGSEMILTSMSIFMRPHLYNFIYNLFSGKFDFEKAKANTIHETLERLSFDITRFDPENKTHETQLPAIFFDSLLKYHAIWHTAFELKKMSLMHNLPDILAQLTNFKSQLRILGRVNDEEFFNNFWTKALFFYLKNQNIVFNYEKIEVIFSFLYLFCNITHEKDRGQREKLFSSIVNLEDFDGEVYPSAKIIFNFMFDPETSVIANNHADARQVNKAMKTDVFLYYLAEYSKKIITHQNEHVQEIIRAEILPIIEKFKENPGFTPIDVFSLMQKEAIRNPNYKVIPFLQNLEIIEHLTLDLNSLIKIKPANDMCSEEKTSFKEKLQAFCIEINSVKHDKKLNPLGFEDFPELFTKEQKNILDILFGKMRNTQRINNNEPLASETVQLQVSLHVMSAMPQNLQLYKRSYIYILGNLPQLIYVKRDELIIQRLTIQDHTKLRHIGATAENIGKVLLLTHAQVGQLITENTSQRHMPEYEYYPRLKNNPPKVPEMTDILDQRIIGAQTKLKNNDALVKLSKFKTQYQQQPLSVLSGIIYEMAQLDPSKNIGHEVLYDFLLDLFLEFALIYGQELAAKQSEAVPIQTNINIAHNQPPKRYSPNNFFQPDYKGAGNSRISQPPQHLSTFKALEDKHAQQKDDQKIETYPLSGGSRPNLSNAPSPSIRIPLKVASAQLRPLPQSLVANNKILSFTSAPQNQNFDKGPNKKQNGSNEAPPGGLRK